MADHDKKDLIKPAMGIILRDESLYSGAPDSISSPETAAEVCQIVRLCRDMGDPITVCGSLTAMNGAGVPCNGHSMSTARLDTVTYDPKTQTLWAEAGATFRKIQQTLHRDSRGARDLPVVPTESTATLGGALSFRTSGIRSFRYGSFSDQVLELEYCDAEGTLRRISRDHENFPFLLGSEGMYGIFTGARLKTIPKVPHTWGLLFFFDREDIAAAFAEEAETIENISALEYLDRACLTLLRTHGSNLNAVKKLPRIPGDPAAAIYLELDDGSEAAIEESAERLLVCLDEAGGDPDSSWSAVGEETQQFRDLHHAVMECINRKTVEAHSDDAAVTRLTYPFRLIGADTLALLNNRREALSREGLGWAVFGHWGSGRVISIHIFAGNGRDMGRGQQLLEHWYREDLNAGRAALEIPGIGKVYRELLCQSAPTELLKAKKSAKERLDPENRFNPGNLFPVSEK